MFNAMEAFKNDFRCIAMDYDASLLDSGASGTMRGEIT
jgi:hypothetical protein